jgi:ketosteroid isomerase-like protein
MKQVNSDKSNMDDSLSFAKEHIKKWINAWNNHDIKTVLSMYSDNIEFSSPKIKVVFPESKSSKISNKKDLEEYWSKALKNNFSNLHFTPKEIVVQGNICILEYYAELDGKNKTSVIEKFQFQDGIIKKSDVFYGSEEENT